MGFNKSIRYEVLVYSKTNTSSTNEQQHQQTTSSLMADDDSSSADSNSANPALFETRIQRFTCDRENMQQYWIPEGYHPVLVPRAYLSANSLVATSNNISRQLMNTARNLSSGNAHQLQSRINDNLNDIELRRRRILNNNSSSNNGGVVKKKRRNNNINVNALNSPNANRRTILGQSSPTVNINATIHRQRVKERISAIRNSAVSISSNSSLKNNHGLSDCNYKSPSITIGEMWKNEPENIKKHYERLAIRKKLAQALAFEKKISSSYGKPNSKPITSSHVLSPRHHVNQRLAVLSNAVEGVNVVNCSGSPLSSTFDNNTAVQIIHQNVDNSSNGHRSFDKVNPAPSSPISQIDQRIKNNNRPVPVPDWMIHSDEEGYDENSSEIDLDTDNNSTITTIAY